jgi:hypothetical protein
MRRPLLFAVRFLLIFLVAAIAEMAAINAIPVVVARLMGHSYSRGEFEPVFEAGNPVIVLAYTLPPFLAAIALGRSGFLIGGLVGGAYELIVAWPDIASLYGSPYPLDLVILAPALEHLNGALARAIIGAFAGAAGELACGRIRDYAASHGRTAE